MINRNKISTRASAGDSPRRTDLSNFLAKASDMTNRNKVPTKASAPLTGAMKHKYDEERIMEERRRNTPKLERRGPRNVSIEAQRTSIPEFLISKLPSESDRNLARMVTHGIARTGNTILRTLDIPNRIFGNTRSLLQDIYEKSEANLARDAYEGQNGVHQVGETAVHLASAGILGKALPAVFGANVGTDTYETAKYAGASEGEALAKGVGHGVVDTAIWTLGQGLASKYLPKAWQWLGRELTGAMRGAASSVTSDAMLNSLGADISGEEMAERAVHAAWMVPLLGMLKMGGERREEAMSLLRKARPDLAGAKVDKVIETIEAEFSDPKSQKVALAWVARKGANLPDDTAQIRQALEVSSKVKGLDPMSRSPFEILSDPAYARYLPKPKPQDVKAFSNMKRYPMGVIGFDVSDDAAGRQATREMINAYMSPSSNPWCLATGKDAAKLGGLGPEAEGYWKSHSAVPKQIFFQDMEGDGNLALIAFRATDRGGEGRQEYWDTSDAGYSGIPLKVKVPGDPLGRYQKMVFRPATEEPDIVTFRDVNGDEYAVALDNARAIAEGDPHATSRLDPRDVEAIREAYQHRVTTQNRPGEVPGTFEDVAPGEIFKGDPFLDGRSQTWALVKQEQYRSDGTGVGIGHDVSEVAGPIEIVVGREGGDFPTIGAAQAELQLMDSRPPLDEFTATADEIMEDREYNEAYRRALVQAIDNAVRNSRFAVPSGETPQYVLTEDKVRTTENGITKFRTTKYHRPMDWDYEPSKSGGQPKPFEIEESELVNPVWMRARGYDPGSEADVRRMQQELGIRAWGNGVEAAMAVVPTRRTILETKSGTPETMVYGPNGRDVVSVDFTKDGVPYREEYFESLPDVGYADPSYLYHTFDPYSFPRPSAVYGQNMSNPTGYRLVRDPDSASPEVLNEIRWDEGLGGYVRTSGNRRWSLARTGSTERVLVEDRQPDGTWAPAVDRFVNTETGEAFELPPPPPEPPVMDDKGGDTRRDIRAAEGAGDTEGPDGAPVETPMEAPAEAPVDGGGPRIVINPEVFEDKRDALCVAMNEAFRVLMEVNGFNPVSEPTEAQRQFFADTAYSQNENQMRRTILARICTFDTSVKDPTEEQLEESVEFLEAVMEMGAPQNEWEQQAVQRIHDVLVAAIEKGTSVGDTPTEEPPAPEDVQDGVASSGSTDEEEEIG